MLAEGSRKRNVHVKGGERSLKGGEWWRQPAYRNACRGSRKSNLKAERV